MPLVKSYRRYEPARTLAVVCSPAGNIVTLPQEQIAVPALGAVYVYSTRTAERVAVLGDENSTKAVTALALHPDGRSALAVGYDDGSILLFDPSTGAQLVVFQGHRGSVNVMRFLDEGARLVSGSNDTDLIVWDVVNESGLFRLRGHKGAVTDCVYIGDNILLSSSKDTFIRAWDLESQHCVETIVGHRTEVWALATDANMTHVLSGSTDNELRVWQVVRPSIDALGTAMEVQFVSLGSIERQSRERVLTLAFDPSFQLLGCQAADKTIEFFKVNTPDDVKRRLSRRAKRKREKLRSGVVDAAAAELVVEIEQKLEDEFYPLGSMKASSKIRSFAFAQERGAGLKLVVQLANNEVQIHEVTAGKKSVTAAKISSISQMGHRSPIRSLSLNSDDRLLLSTSNAGAKVWNRLTGKCIRTLDAGYGLCALFCPGDRHVVIGTQAGELQLFDLSSGACLETVDAHAGAIWSIDLHPEKHGFVTGSADHEVKFWEFELVSDESSDTGSRRLSCAHVKTLKMTDDVLAVKFSPDARLLAMALLDNTVKVFFADTLKFFLSLYGHKLPITSIDISKDSTLLLTGSADKNVKIWGLDFGDCHKSIFAHQDVITEVKFVGTTHHFFTASKDKIIKQWDGDNFQQIMKLEAHHGEVSCMVLSTRGDTLCTGSHDKSIRIWERSKEILTLEEEQENEREQQYESERVEAEGRVARAQREKEGEVGMASKQTQETLKAAEKIVEAIELVEVEEQKPKGEPKHPLLGAFQQTPSEYLLSVVAKVTSAELDEALLVLPFTYAMKLLPYLSRWIRQGSSVERCVRCMVFLVRVHQNQMISNDVLLPVVEHARRYTKDKLQSLKATIGFNLAGLHYLQRELEVEGIRFFEDAQQVLESKGKKKRRKIVKS